MKYIHLIPWSPKENFGGYETIIRTTAQSQADNGHTVWIIGRVESKGRNIITEVVHGVTYIEIHDPYKRRPSSLAVGVNGLLLLLIEILYSVFRIAPVVIRLVKEEKIDVVIFYGIHLFLISPMLLQCNTKTLLGLEVIQKNPHPSKLSIIYWFRKVKYSLFSGIFTYTHYFYLPNTEIIDNISLIRSYTSTPLFYIPWGIDVQKVAQIIKKSKKHIFSKKRKGKIVICPRRIVEEKGVQYLVEAIPRILKRFPDSLFVFAGDGILRGQLESRVTKLNIQNNVLFTGFLTHEDTLCAIAASDIVVVPSSGEESFGMVFLEAYVCKKPIVTTWFGGIPNVVQDKKTGILVQPKDSLALSEAISELLSNEKKAEMLAENGFALVFKEFTLEKTLKTLDESVKKLGK